MIDRRNFQVPTPENCYLNELAAMSHTPERPYRLIKPWLKKKSYMQAYGVSTVEFLIITPTTCISHLHSHDADILTHRFRSLNGPPPAPNDIQTPPGAPQVHLPSIPTWGARERARGGERTQQRERVLKPSCELLTDYLRDREYLQFIGDVSRLYHMKL